MIDIRLLQSETPRTHSQAPMV